MEKTKIEELAMATAMVEYYQKIIENAKDEIRKLTNEEIEQINKGNDLIIQRQKYTKTIYSQDYLTAKKELEEKYPPEKAVIENHTIKLTPTAYTIAKQKLITNTFTKLNKTQLKLSASATKTKANTQKGVK